MDSFGEMDPSQNHHLHPHTQIPWFDSSMEKKREDLHCLRYHYYFHRVVVVVDNRREWNLEEEVEALRLYHQIHLNSSHFSIVEVAIV